MSRQPLVRGGILRNVRYPSQHTQSSYITTTVPEIYDNTIVVAATHPNVAKGHPTVDGWFLSDFYAFNYLLKGLGSSQIWLTAADPRKLLKALQSDADQKGKATDQYGQDPPPKAEYLHGNPHQDRRVVLNEDLLDREELTPVTIVKNTEMIDRFLNEVRQASKKAIQQNAPLLLFLFCHGMDDFTYLLDHGAGHKGLTVTRLKEAIEPGCRVTLVSTACFGGGWVVWDLLDHPLHVPLDATMLAAASHTETSNSWHKSVSMGRFCGSVFASSLINSLTSAASPLLEDKSSHILDPPSMQPDNASSQQTATYNSFCRSILDVCQSEVTCLWDYQHFTFSAQGDKWDDSWTRRSGVPLSHFRERWNALPVVTYRGSITNKMNMDPDPCNPTFQGSAGPSKVGGEELINDITKSIHQHRVSGMARLFLDTCPGDWDSGWGPYFHGMLCFAADLKLPYEELKVISAAIRFRWEAALIADQLVKEFELPVPRGEQCILWDRFKWNGQERRKYADGYSRAFGRLRRIKPHPAPDHGPPFQRFLEYMAAAVAEADLSDSSMDTLVEALAKRMDDIKAFYIQRALADDVVLRRGDNWFKSIGKKLKSSLRRPRSESLAAEHMDSTTGDIRPKTPEPMNTEVDEE